MVPAECEFTEADTSYNSSWKMHQLQPTQGSLRRPNQCLFRAPQDDRDTPAFSWMTLLRLPLGMNHREKGAAARALYPGT